MERSEFREYVFDWTENFPMSPRLVELFDAQLLVLSFRREAYDPATNRRPGPLAMYLEFDKKPQEYAQIHFGGLLHLLGTHLHSIAEVGVPALTLLREVEVRLKLVGNRPEQQQVMAVTAKVLNALGIKGVVPTLTLTNQPYVRYKGEWMPEGQYLHEKFLKGKLRRLGMMSLMGD